MNQGTGADTECNDRAGAPPLSRAAPNDVQGVRTRGNVQEKSDSTKSHRSCVPNTITSFFGLQRGVAIEAVFRPLFGRLVEFGKRGNAGGKLHRSAWWR